MLEVKGVTKRFGGITAVDSLSFSAGRGEIFGLLGPNGAGKSTTIKMIMNILRPESGEILFSGKRIGERDKSRIGYLPEERGLYRRARVTEMLFYLSDLKGTRRAVSRPRIYAWLDRFGLAEHANRRIEELSKGMMQKVQFIAAVAHDPELLFLDEPFTGLDPLSSDLLLDSIRQFGNEGRTILFSTHAMEQAERLCSSIMLLDKGREVISGPLSDVRNRYGSNSVQIDFDGNIDFVRELPFVAGVVRYPRSAEVSLSGEGAPQQLFQALAGRVAVSRFEVVAPSLHKIFVDLIGNNNGGAE